MAFYRKGALLAKYLDNTMKVAGVEKGRDERERERERGRQTQLMCIVGFT